MWLSYGALRKIIAFLKILRDCGKRLGLLLGLRLPFRHFCPSIWLTLFILNWSHFCIAVWFLLFGCLCMPFYLPSFTMNLGFPFKKDIFIYIYVYIYCHKQNQLILSPLSLIILSTFMVKVVAQNYHMSWNIT